MLLEWFEWNLGYQKANMVETETCFAQLLFSSRKVKTDSNQRANQLYQIYKSVFGSLPTLGREKSPRCTAISIGKGACRFFQVCSELVRGNFNLTDKLVITVSGFKPKRTFEEHWRAQSQPTIISFSYKYFGICFVLLDFYPDKVIENFVKCMYKRFLGAVARSARVAVYRLVKTKVYFGYSVWCFIETNVVHWTAFSSMNFEMLNIKT